MNREHILAWIAALLLTALAYAPTLGGDFLLDDYGLGLFTEHGEASWGQGLRYFFPSHLTRDQFLRPLPVLAGVLDLTFWGVNPFGFHLTNLLIHLVGALLTGVLAGRLTSRRGVGPLATLAYGLYPGHAEAVAWIVHRMVGLCVVFYLLALLLHTKRGLRPLAWLSALAALLCKEPAANLPAVVFLLHFYREPRGDPRRRILDAARSALPYAVVVLVYAGWKQLAFGAVVTGYGRYDSYFGYFLGEKIYRDLPMSLVRFLSPVNSTLASPLVAWLHGMIAAVGLGLLGVYGRRRRESRAVLRFGLALALLSLIFVFPFLSVPAGLTNSRHFSVPAVGLALATAALLVRQTGRGRVAAGIWLLLYCLPLPLNLGPYQEAGRIARAVRLGVLRRAAAYPPDTLILVARVPSEVHGAPVFGDGAGLKGALAPPFAPRAHRVLVTLDDPPGDPDSVLLTTPGPFAVLVVEGGAGTGGPAVREVSPPARVWRYPAPETIALLAPGPDADVVLGADPTFAFRSREAYPFYRIVFEAGSRVFPVTVSREDHLRAGADGRLLYRLTAGGVHASGLLDRPEIRAVRGPVTWYVEGVRDFTRPRSALARSPTGRFRVGGP